MGPRLVLVVLLGAILHLSGPRMHAIAIFDAPVVVGSYISPASAAAESAIDVSNVTVPRRSAGL